MQQRNRAQSAANGAMFGGARAIGQYNNAMVNGALAKNLQNRNMSVSPSFFLSHPINLLFRTPQGLQAMQGKAMGQQMQRDPSNMEMNGQRPQTPGDNAPSPTKRPRLDNGPAFEAQAMANRQVSGSQPMANMGANGTQHMIGNGVMANFTAGANGTLKLEVSLYGLLLSPLS
jgi:hypothetical protein